MCRTELWCRLRAAAAKSQFGSLLLVFTPRTARGTGGMLRPFYPCLAWPGHLGLLPAGGQWCSSGSATGAAAVLAWDCSCWCVRSIKLCFPAEPCQLLVTARSLNHILYSCSKVGRPHRGVLFHRGLPSLALVMETELMCQSLHVVFFGSYKGVMLQVLTKFILFYAVKRGKSPYKQWCNQWCTSFCISPSSEAWSVKKSSWELKTEQTEWMVLCSSQ